MRKFLFYISVFLLTLTNLTSDSPFKQPEQDKKNEFHAFVQLYQEATLTNEQTFERKINGIASPFIPLDLSYTELPSQLIVKEYNQFIPLSKLLEFLTPVFYEARYLFPSLG